MTDQPNAPTPPQADLYAWTGIFLADGRMISAAWLLGWPGAVASPPRDGACPVHGEPHRLASQATTAGGAG